MTCTGCGHRYLAKAGTRCTQCRGVNNPGDEFTRKTFDEPDLKK